MLSQRRNGEHDTREQYDGTYYRTHGLHAAKWVLCSFSK